MKLPEISEALKSAIDGGHLLISTCPGVCERVRSVALRVDEDGIVSVILFDRRQPGRIVPADERARRRTTAEAVAGWKECCEAVPELASGEKPADVLYSLDLVARLMEDAGLALEVGDDPFEELEATLREKADESTDDERPPREAEGAAELIE